MKTKLYCNRIKIIEGDLFKTKSIKDNKVEKLNELRNKFNSIWKEKKKD